MTAESLLRFYPRAWRARYGAELLQLVGPRALSAQQTFDMLAGAVDAWISPSVRAAVRRQPSAAAVKGGLMVRQFLLKCSTSNHNQYRMTTRDGLISAAVLLAVSLVFTAAGIYASSLGYTMTADILKSIAFPGAVLLSMPFGVMKGQPRRAQLIVLGPTMLLIALATVIATRI
jgi:hypothetical protein